jgi:hypothetical protein
MLVGIVGPSTVALVRAHAGDAIIQGLWSLVVAGEPLERLGAVLVAQAAGGLPDFAVVQVSGTAATVLVRGSVRVAGQGRDRTSYEAAAPFATLFLESRFVDIDHFVIDAVGEPVEPIVLPLVAGVVRAGRLECGLDVGVVALVVPSAPAADVAPAGDVARVPTAPVFLVAPAFPTAPAFPAVPVPPTVPVSSAPSDGVAPPVKPLLTRGDTGPAAVPAPWAPVTGARGANHDGRTRPSQVRVDSAVPAPWVPGDKVHASMCESDHPNNPTAARCRICELPLDINRPTVEIDRPVLGVLTFSNGYRLEVRRSTVVIARQPRARHGDAQLVQLDRVGVTTDISIAIRVVDWIVEIVDLGSSGVVRVAAKDARPVPLERDRPVIVQFGATVDLAGESTFRYEAPGKGETA